MANISEEQRAAEAAACPYCRRKKWSEYAESEAGQLEYALYDISQLRAELAIFRAEQARWSEVTGCKSTVEYADLSERRTVGALNEFAERRCIEVAELRAQLRAAVAALRPVLAGWQTVPEWHRAAAIVAAYDAKHPEAK